MGRLCVERVCWRSCVPCEAVLFVRVMWELCNKRRGREERHHPPESLMIELRIAANIGGISHVLEGSSRELWVAAGGGRREAKHLRS